MTPNIHPVSVLVAVQPHLLATAIGRVLDERRADVTVVRGWHPSLGGAVYDVAIVTGELPHGVRAETTIHLPGTTGRAAGLVRHHGRSSIRPIASLRDVVRLVDESRLDAVV